MGGSWTWHLSDCWLWTMPCFSLPVISGLLCQIIWDLVRDPFDWISLVCRGNSEFPLVGVPVFFSHVCGGGQGRSHSSDAGFPLFPGNLACCDDLIGEKGASSTAHLSWLLHHQFTGSCDHCLNIRSDWQQYTWDAQLFHSAWPGKPSWFCYIHVTENSFVLRIECLCYVYLPTWAGIQVRSVTDCSTFFFLGTS